MTAHLSIRKSSPFVVYGRAVSDLEKAIYRLIDKHKEMKLNRYGDILRKATIQWSGDSMRKADVSALDGRTVMAMLVGAVRAERFCDGALKRVLRRRKHSEMARATERN